MDAVEEVKSRLSIEDVIGEYVQLKRSGRNFKGLSPFTNEKSPSLMVSPEKQIWHDFSSGRGGNMFSFVMEMEGLDFRGALELLARKAGVDLDASRGRGGTSGKDKERLFAALTDAANFYQRCLTKDKQALEYLRNKRGFTKETILEFKLGYSPSAGELTKFLLAKGYSQAELKSAGLATERSGRISDMFRGRIMVPLTDPQGAVIGFTARQLVTDTNGPKYINTPSTPLYDKSRHIYGLAQAKQAIRNCNYVVVAEGNLDVISSHQAGIKQVVATAGTAMTSQQFSQLKRFTGDVRLSFDADRAGQTAAERAIPLAQATGVNLSIITIPEGKDPDELVRKNPGAWQEAIDNPKYAVDWLIDRYLETLDTSTAVGKTRLTDVILTVVRKLQDPVEQDHYLDVLARIAGSSSEALKAKLAHESGTKRLRKPANQPKLTSLPEFEKRAQHFLGIMLLFPSLRDLMLDLPEDIFTDDAAKLFQFLQQSSAPHYEAGQALSQSAVSYRETEQGVQKYDAVSTADKNSAMAKEAGSAISFADWQARWPDLRHYVKMLALLAEEGYGRTEPEELRYQTEGLRSRIVADYVRTKKQKLSAELTENPKNSAELLEQAHTLDKLQQKFK